MGLYLRTPLGGSDHRHTGSNDSITYASLLKRCKELKNLWGSPKAECVALWVRNDLDTIIGMFALRYCGYTVSLFRSPPDEVESDALLAMQIDHVLHTNGWSLDAVDHSEPHQSHEMTLNGGWDDVAFEIQTSGTTGDAEWILDDPSITPSAFGSAIRLGHLPGDRWLNPLSPGFMGWLKHTPRSMAQRWSSVPGGSVLNYRKGTSLRYLSSQVCWPNS